jgi:hypothetical protein
LSVVLIVATVDAAAIVPTDLPRLADELIRRLRGVVGTIPSELPICTIDAF